MRHLDRNIECPECSIRSVIRDQNLVEHQVSLVKQRQGQNENQQYSNHCVIGI
jgi:DNA-directed RNA polymerase subunit RPC12/RpoP